MALLTASIIAAVVLILAILVSSLPLYLAVNMLGGKATILNVLITNIVVAVVAALISETLGYSGLIVLVITIFIYMLMFKMGIIRAFLAWLIQYVVAAILVIVALLLFGISIVLPL